MLFSFFLLLALADPPARFHHVHMNSLDPAEDMEYYARHFQGVKVILPGLGVGVRLGTSYLLFERVDEEPRPGNAVLDGTKLYLLSDDPAGAGQWFAKTLGLKPADLNLVIVGRGSPFPTSGRVVDHLAVSYPDLKPVRERLGPGAFLDGPDGLRIELVEDAELGAPRYWCPMDPKVRTAEPGKCPVCGMVLVPLDPGEYVEYPVKLEVKPAKLRAGQPGTLRFSVRNPHEDEAVTSFEVVHEKLFHLFVVSHDLSYFAHVHPEPQADGSFVIETTFPKPGPYQLYADFFPSGGTPQVVPKTFITAGYQGSLAQARRPLAPDTVLQKTEQGTRVRLQNAQFLSGRKQNLVFTLADERTGEPIKDLEPYLGAWGHMLILSEDLADYVHTHAAAPGSQLDFEAIFPRPGNYRVWIQFQRNGQVITVAFNVAVSRLK